MQKKYLFILIILLLSFQTSAGNEPKRSGIVNFLIGSATITTSNGTKRATSVLKIMANSTLTITQLSESDKKGSKSRKTLQKKSFQRFWLLEQYSQQIIIRNIRLIHIIKRRFHEGNSN
jgi:hypothetical protein